ncbi:MAG: type II secretion system major pseudopilin GspG [Deltaproteobacteria bacterium]|nr:type II secretion system major pseudopilin GspG [Deltaproteobacteria bacterium]
MRHLRKLTAVLRAYRRTNGFTLLEVMVVLVILGLIVGTVSVAVFSQLEKAKRREAVLQIRAIEQALDAYRLDNGKYPSTADGLDALTTKNDSGECYLKGCKLPKDPWGNDYVYISPGQHGGGYDIESYGSDGADGGEKDIESWNM